jgi:hypothetical protein
MWVSEYEQEVEAFRSPRAIEPFICSIPSPTATQLTLPVHLRHTKQDSFCRRQLPRSPYSYENCMFQLAEREVEAAKGWYVIAICQ